MDKSQAAGERFGREIGIEHFGGDLRRDSFTVVGNADFDVATGGQKRFASPL